MLSEVIFIADLVAIKQDSFPVYSWLFFYLFSLVLYLISLIDLYISHITWIRYFSFFIFCSLSLSVYLSVRSRALSVDTVRSLC